MGEVFGQECDLEICVISLPVNQLEPEKQNLLADDFNLFALGPVCPDIAGLHQT